MRLPRVLRVTPFRMGALATAAVVALDLLVSQTGPVRRLEAQLIDLRFQLRGPVAPAGNIALVLVDDRSLEELGRWPLSRSYFAALVRRLDTAGARVIAFDLLFNEPDTAMVSRETFQRSADADFAAAMREANGVVLPFYFSFAGGPARPASFVAREPALPAAAYQSFRPVAAGAPGQVPDADLLIPPVPRLAEAADALAYVNVFPGADGQPRLEAAAIRHGELYYPSLPVAAARLWLDLAPQEVRLELGRGIQIGPIFVPTDRSMRFPVNYRGPAGSFPTLSFTDVWHGRVPDSAFAGRIVIVGASAVGLGETFASPYASALPGPERYAAIIDSILQRDLLMKGPETIVLSLLLASLAGLTAAALQAGLPLLWSGLGTAAVTAAVGAAIVLAFNWGGLVLHAVFPSIAAVAAFAAAALHGLALARREGRQMRYAFTHYLHPDVVDALARNPHQVRLGGEERVLTVLFSDIRGFSEIAERLTPEALIGFMNDYLSVMTRLVLRHNGLLDKYIGDGIMAIYGAPVARPEHALDACRTALAMAAAVRDMRDRWRSWGIDELRIGIGIATGPMIIGNIGAAERFDYTVLGDTVNLGERLEKANKQFGTSIVLSEATWMLVRDATVCRELGTLAVQGKRGPVRVFELVDIAPPPQD